MDEGDLSLGGDFGDSAVSSDPPNDIAFDTCKEARDAALKWLAKGRKKRLSDMSPMDEMKWFQPPKWTTISVTGSQPVQLCDGNPQRIILMIQASGAMRICTDVKHLRDGGGFLFQTGSLCTWQVEQKHEAILSQAEWWGMVASGTVSAEVLEVLLKDWPNGS